MFWISNVFLMIMNDKVNIHMSEGDESEWVPIVSTSPSLRPQKLHCFIHVGASWADSLKCVKKSKSTLHDEMTPVTTLVWKKKEVISTFLLFVTGWLHDTHTSTYLSVWPLWTCKFDFYLLTSCQRVDVADVLFIKLLCEKKFRKKSENHRVLKTE